MPGKTSGWTNKKLIAGLCGSGNVTKETGSQEKIILVTFPTASEHLRMSTQRRRDLFSFIVLICGHMTPCARTVVS